MKTRKRAFNTAEAADYVGLSSVTLRQSRMTGPRAKRINAPQHTKLGSRKVVYLLEDLDSWLDAQREETVCGAGEA